MPWGAKFEWRLSYTDFVMDRILSYEMQIQVRISIGSISEIVPLNKFSVQCKWKQMFLVPFCDDGELYYDL